MAWSAAFVAALNDRTATPTFHLGVISGFSGMPGRWDVQTHRDISGWGIIEGVQVQGAGLQLLDWTCSFGGFSVQIATDNPHVLLTQIVKGQIVALSAKFPGTSAEPIAVGMVRNVSGVGGRYTIECSDFLSALGSRNTQTASELALFSGIQNSTTLTADYTAGDATINVADTTGFDREDSGSGLIWIHPSGVYGEDSFAITYTGKTGTTFTGCSAAGVAGTTAANVSASASESITEGAWIDDHPIHMALKVLTSTGTAAANGSYDTLPRTWAYGIPQAYVDAADAATYVVLSTPASGSDDWHFAVGTPQTDGFGWLQQVLYLGGFFLVPLQGGISVRCIADPEDMREEAHIYSRDIEEIEEWMAYDPDYQVEYGTVTIQSDSGSYASPDSAYVGSLPAEEGTTVDVSSLVFANETAIRNEVANRIVPWLARIPERMVVRCAGRRMAALAPGDRVSITTDLVTGRLESTKRGYDRRAALVTRVDPDWMRGAVRLHLAILPTFADALVS